MSFNIRDMRPTICLLTCVLRYVFRHASYDMSFDMRPTICLWTCVLRYVFRYASYDMSLDMRPYASPHRDLSKSQSIKEIRYPQTRKLQTQILMQGIKKEAEYKETQEGSVRLWPAVLMSSPNDSVKVCTQDPRICPYMCPYVPL